MIPTFSYYPAKIDMSDPLGQHRFVSVSLTPVSGMNYSVSGDARDRLSLLDEMPVYMLRRIFRRVVDPRELVDGVDYVWSEDK